MITMVVDNGATAEIRSAPKEMVEFVASRFGSGRKDEQRRWLKNHQQFASYMASQWTRGWAFMLSKDPVKAEQQRQAHGREVEAMVSVALQFIAKHV